MESAKCQDFAAKIEILKMKIDFLTLQNESYKQQIDRYDVYINQLLKRKNDNHQNESLIQNNNDRIPLMGIYKENLSRLTFDEIRVILESSPCMEKIAELIENGIFEGKNVPIIKAISKNKFNYLDENKNIVTITLPKFAELLCSALLEIMQPVAKQLHHEYDHNVLSDNTVYTETQIEAETTKDDNRHNNIMMLKQNEDRIKILKMFSNRVKY